MLAIQIQANNPSPTFMTLLSTVSALQYSYLHRIHMRSLSLDIILFIGRLIGFLGW